MDLLQHGNLEVQHLYWYKFENTWTKLLQIKSSLRMKNNFEHSFMWTRNYNES